MSLLMCLLLKCVCLYNAWCDPVLCVGGCSPRWLHGCALVCDCGVPLQCEEESVDRDREMTTLRKRIKAYQQVSVCRG